MAKHPTIRSSGRCKRRAAVELKRYAAYIDGRLKMAYTLPPQALDHNLVLEFFWKFSVFECALKREGFLKAGRNNAAEPDWDKFGHEVQGRFSQVSAPMFKESVEKLKKLSPRRQVVRNGALGWDAVVQQPGDSDEAFIFRLLKTARNNLFHGGKYPDGTIEEIARDQDILRAGSAILDACYELHRGVKGWIDEAA
jgi:hypothetical protein